MLIIDGNHGEGGGQLVRTAVALSIVFNKEIKVKKIRAGRDKSGLKTQHLYAIKALQELTNAEVSGLSLGSSELVFKPSKWVKDEAVINIPTAGSIGLVIQCLLPALITAPKETNVSFIGGATCGKWSPSLDYINNVLFPNLELIGVKKPELIIEQQGYYPKGGALVKLKVQPSKIKPLIVKDKGKVLNFKGLSHASNFLKNRRVAERQAIAAKELIKDLKIKTTYSESLCPGSSITLWAEGEKSIIGADSLGEIGKTSETVGREAANKLLKELTQGAFDSHTTDMLIPYIALAGKGEITTSSISSHTKTNIWLCEQFIKKRFNINGLKIKL